jgi:O-acetyl-ADP-ribose deacetylase (regulator of RNase III)
MYLYAADKFSKSLSATDCPEELHIIDVDTTILKLVEQSVKRWKENPESISQRNTLPKYLEENPHQAGYSGSEGQRSYDGHMAGRRHRGGDGNQQSGRSPGDGVNGNDRRHRNPSPQNEIMEETYEIESSISRLEDKRLSWGGYAKMFILNQQLTVMIYKGEISRVKEVDSVVCSIGTDLEPKGFISSTLQSAGGPTYTSDYKKMKDKHKGFLMPRDVFKCKAGKLPVKYILHVVTSRVVEADTREIQTYKECVYSVLKKARRNDLEKLAIPLFATGIKNELFIFLE